MGRVRFASGNGRAAVRPRALRERDASLVRAGAWSGPSADGKWGGGDTLAALRQENAVRRQFDDRLRAVGL
jgi:hypothetical protein